MTDYQYHSMDDLRRLGEKIRDKAIKVTLHQQESYEQAQREANNDATRHETGQPTRSQNYHPSADGRADDDGNLSAYVHDAYSAIPQLFTQFGVPDPAAMQPSVDTLYQTAVTLQPSLSVKANGADITTPMLVSGAPAVAPVKDCTDIMEIHLKSWKGLAANAFDLYFKQLESASVLQHQIAIDLANGLEAMAAIRRSMLTDVWTIGTVTYKALDELDGWCSHSAKEVARLTIVGALAAVAYAATDGVAAVLVETVQSAATIMSSMATINQPAEQNIEGATVPPILDGMATALNRVRAATEEQERVVAQAMATVSASLEQKRKRALIRAPYELTTAASLPVAALQPGSRFAFYDD
ncbi:hypothetical protein [Actinoplanes sp. L3-i22]|uniref:hypothetical protein n=1 Tax=Actinoplanes sp. L3-i22 TaxID=2836373 RepID=UPI001C7993E4|nr:hypothetical protein [Actinoplanes sp. L3-i22]BCY13192.1 hypothetical protein L3i22_082800 [Actinoplanes sp. L3-i22]